MREKRAEFSPEIERIVAAIDPRSSVSPSIQLRGALEFGIASGELSGGQRLPSVRGLARRVGVSPGTVSNVYAALQAAGHAEGRAGSGTYVSTSARGDMRLRLAEIDARIAELIALGRAGGITPAELSLRVSMARTEDERPVAILMVGNFHDVTEAYAVDIRTHLRNGDRIRAITLADLTEDAVRGVDLIVAPRTLLSQIREIAPQTETLGVTLIPNEATRVALAALASDARVAGYSYFPGFVPIMKAGIRRFAPHVSDLTMVVRGEEAAEARLAQADVLIYASGSDYLLRDLHPGQAAFEYRHAPDVHSIRTEILPAIELCRHQSQPERDAAE